LVRKPFSDHVGDFVERLEAGLHPVGHEGVNPVGAGLIHVRHDVDQHHRASDAG
jgi:hypothetical protein